MYKFLQILVHGKYKNNAKVLINTKLVILGYVNILSRFL